jgi:ribosome recycling factor
MMKGNYKEIEEKMIKTIHFLEEDFGGIRAGRANPSILDKVHVDYYGVSTPISQVGNVSVPEARMLVIQPWDASITKEVEKAIQKSDIGITPNSDGKVIRLNFPQLTEERRKDLIKSVHRKGEDAKVAVRSIRRDALEQFKVQKKNSEITEDDLKDIEKDVQILTDKYISEVDEVVKAKEQELIEV